MPQNTNLNSPPYFDDFDPKNNYARVLFKPGTSIQARELTTLQSIQQNQIENFGKHFFKEGAVVIPGNIAYDPEYFCVEIDPSHLGVPIELYISKLLGKLIRGSTSGVTAKVENIVSDLESERGNFTLYVKYRSSSDTDFSTNTFTSGENLIVLENIDYGISIIRSGTTFATTIISDAASIGSAIKIESGVYFIRGFFVDVFAQTLILEQYSNLPTYRIGLSIDENIAIASEQNQDLFDNARGFSNFAAPGADRLQITATLIKKSIDDLSDENFVELARIIDGVRQYFTPSGEDTTSLITKELARRTFDESGNYYVLPFDVQVKESLNNKLGNNGIYNEGQLTSQGNVPSNNLLTVQVSPGKAYVRGFEVETLNTVNIDIVKPRTTAVEENTTVPFDLGNQIPLNNVFGTLPIGYGSTVKLFSKRTTTPGSSSGLEIGLAEAYDLKLQSSNYTGPSSVYNIALFDVQTYDYLILNTSITLTSPCFIEGKHGGASGYLVYNVTNSNQLILYGVNGVFVKDEPILINGQEITRTVKEFRDYSLDDVFQITSLNGTSFTADTVLSPSFQLAPTGSVYSISANAGGISNITNASSTFGVGISTDDVVAYVKPGETLPTFNRVLGVNQALKTIEVESTTSVVGVSSGGLPASVVNTSEVFVVTPTLLNNSSSSFFAKLRHTSVASADLKNSQITIKKSYPVTISNNSLVSTLESDIKLSLEPYDEEDYSLVFDDGVIEPLFEQNFDAAGRTITLTSLSRNGTATLTVTFRRTGLKSRKKLFQKSTSFLIENSSNQSSGTGGASLNDGLTFSPKYGTRVQDERISLGVCDVKRVLAIFESSDTNVPLLPKLQLTNLNTNILNSVVGELIQGQDSKALAVLVSNNGSDTVEFVYSNENSFLPKEKLIFLESKLTASVFSITDGDRNIASSFSFFDGSTSEICDYSYITRKKEVTSPSRKLRVIYQNYIIDPTDDGDFVTVDSFDADLYDIDLMESGGVSASDIIDLRPRVVPYNSSTNPYSPFEFLARNYNPTTNSSPFIFSADKNILLSYSYYLPRTDVIYLTKTGKFIVSSGIPSLDPKPGVAREHDLEVGILEMPAYVSDASILQVKNTIHKRYRMREISNLEDRLRNVEYYSSLSLLETDTKNLSLRDPDTGLDRFKCGFFVDNFKSDSGGSLGDPGHRCSIDTIEGCLRPQHYTTAIDLLLGSEVVSGLSSTSNPDADFRFVKELGNPNTVKVGDIICVKYSELPYLTNNFATRFENVNPFHVINWIGQIELNPATDTWIETKNSRRVIDQEGDYQSTMQRLGVDGNTGLSPVNWGSWETTWTGSRVVGTANAGRVETGTQQIASNTTRQNVQLSKKRRGVQETTTTTNRTNFTTFTNTTTQTTTNQSRQGIQYRVGQTFQNTNLGERVVSTEVIHTLRSRNVEFIARRCKPKTQLYGFFDNVDMNSYIVPKLIEISMISGSFVVGESVRGTLGTVSFRGRLARTNHKYGPYLAPTQIFVENPYKPSESLPSSYSTTSSLLNIDTASLELQSASGYYGNITKGMRLIGETSGALAEVSNLRLITDVSGTVLGSIFFPDINLPSTPRFTTGVKTFTLSSSKVNSTISGTTDTTGEAKFSSSGTLQNVEETTLRVRNATVQTISSSDSRSSTSTSTSVSANTSFVDRQSTQTRYVDPLAQSFEVVEETGVFITKCEVFFRTKDTTGLPVTMQVRTMQTGLPTQSILPFGEVSLEPELVNISELGTVPTTFEFPSPVYLEGGEEYCVVLLSASNEYTVSISRMGEEDVTTRGLSESEKIIVSQQPLLGSLFKSQNGSTWDPSQLEDLKLKLYRAEFVTTPTTVRFYNPQLDIGNKQIVTLRNNPLDCISRTELVGIGKSLTSSEVSGLQSGVRIFQQNNSKFVGFLKSLSGSVGIGSTLIITQAGIGFTNGFRTYSNINVVTIDGRGVGAKINLSVNNGVAIAATVSVGGTGYNIGNSLTIDYSQTDGLGDNLILSIPNSAGIISAFNGLLIDRIQGNVIQNTSDSLYYVGSGASVSLPGANVTNITVVSDGLHFKTNHSNHGMYSSNDRVTLISLQSDQRPVTLNSSYSSTSTESISVSSVGILTSFENVTVSSINPGYVQIGEEIIRYTGVNVGSNSLTGITRKIDGTFANEYNSNTNVFKYELNGVSLRRINKTHTLSDVDQSKFPTDLDYYYLKINMNTSGTDRTAGNGGGFPELYFREDKSCGSYSDVIIVSSDTTPSATQNIPFNQVRANIQTLLPQETSISGKIRTFSGSTPDGNLISFIDQGFVDLDLDGNTVFQSPRIICSKINEETFLTDYPGKKSLTVELTLKTNSGFVSPIIDLDRVNLITTANRINSKITNYITDSRVNSTENDPVAATYLSTPVFLEKPADNLKVFFDAYRHVTNDIRVMYRIFRIDQPNVATVPFELFPGYENLDINSNIIDPSKNNATPDKLRTPSVGFNDFKSYEFTMQSLPQFNGYQIKIHMLGTNSAFVPRIRDLRVIASI